MLGNIKSIITFICLTVATTTLSQEKGDSVIYLIETGYLISSRGNTPFWLLSNNYSTISYNSPNVWARAGFSGRVGIIKSLSLIYGADLIDHYSGQNELILHQAHVGFKIGRITLRAGRYEQQFGNQDPSLSSGGLIWSGNARPIPDISLSVPEYMPLPFTKKFVEFKGGISHGWFENNQYISDVWLHHKYLFLRIGGTLPVHLEYGLHHFAQWGGKSSNPLYGDLPNDLKTFMKVFLAHGGGENAPVDEASNVIGNHIGSHNLAFDFKANSISLKFYWQTIFEDRSGLLLRNIKDGLWGLSISSESWKYVSNFLVEFINTTDQSGRIHEHYEDSVLIYDGGNDNYFGHFIYQEGWATRGMSIGTPLITSPIFSESNLWPFNNKITALHLGIEGIIKNVNYNALYTYSRNYGTNAIPFPERKDQHSLLLKSTFSNLLPWDISMSVAVAADIGELFENNVGIMLSFRKEGLIKLKSKNNK